jgi:hypothetical protein
LRTPIELTSPYIRIQPSAGLRSSFAAAIRQIRKQLRRRDNSYPLPHIGGGRKQPSNDRPNKSWPFNPHQSLACFTTKQSQTTASDSMHQDLQREMRPAVGWNKQREKAIDGRMRLDRLKASTLPVPSSSAILILRPVP